MKKVSDKQRKIEAKIKAIKRALPKVCEICDSNITSDACHILPRSLFPEYITNHKNFFAGCRECHNLFDNDIAFRQRQEHLKRRAISFAKSTDVTRYFKL